MPEHTRGNGEAGEGASAPVRPFWSGTITFGLVSIPVDLFAAARPRQKSMKMVDKDGHALGRQYHCAKDGEELSSDELVRGYETESGEMIVITDQEFEAVAPEMSRDIELRRFAPLEQIAAFYYDRPYFLAPAGRSAKAYNLLAMTMARTQRVGIGSFVMRGHEYLAAIVSENGVLRMETLRHADEIRTPEFVGLPKRSKAPAKLVNQLVKEIETSTADKLNLSELEDRDAEALHELAQAKEKKGKDVIEQTGLEDEEAEGGGAEIVDLMAVLRKSLAKSAVVQTAEGAPTKAGVTDLAERRAKRDASTKPNGRGRKQADLAKATKSELLEIAADLEIAGRSKMNKAALAKAIAKNQ